MMTDGTAAPNPDVKLVPVLSTEDVGLVAVAKSLLESAGIDYVVRGETVRNVMGWAGGGMFSPALGPAQFQVRESDAPDAIKLLAELGPAGHRF
jgi:Putative prokaryotic signal transducing protein